jgi:hypothetical protein
VDPAQEIAKLRNSINLLEAHIFATQRGNSSTSAAGSVSSPSHQPSDREGWGKNNSPGFLANYSTGGGLYAGPTSAATHLITVSKTNCFLSAFEFRT